MRGEEEAVEVDVEVKGGLALFLFFVVVGCGVFFPPTEAVPADANSGTTAEALSRFLLTEEEEAAATDRDAKERGRDGGPLEAAGPGPGCRGLSAVAAASGEDEESQSSNDGCVLGCPSSLRPLRTEKEHVVLASRPRPLQLGSSCIGAATDGRPISSSILLFFLKEKFSLSYFFHSTHRSNDQFRHPFEMEEELNDYELARARLIARNRERMRTMGLLGAANSLTAAAATAARPAKAAAAAKPRPPRPRPAPQAPTRTSKRLRGENAPRASTGKVGEEEEEEREPSASPPPRWTEEELREIRCGQELSMSERLSDLELSGLIDAAPGVAHFAIVGAQHKGQKRKHYKVTLEGGGRGGGEGGGGKGSAKEASSAACECIDFKIRRKRYGGHCKHIKLVLAQLGLGEAATSDGWEEALERVVMAGKE